MSFVSSIPIPEFILWLYSIGKMSYEWKYLIHLFLNKYFRNILEVHYKKIKGQA